MSDRFDITFDHTFDTKADGDAGGEGGKPAQRSGSRGVEVIMGASRRRQWSTDEKARILFESLVPGANVSAVARRHGINPQQLFGWRKEARDEWAAEEKAKPSSDRPVAATQTTKASTATFVPVMIAAPASVPVPPASPPPAPPCVGWIEIVIGDCVVRVCGDVDARTLSVVLAAVRRSR